MITLFGATGYTGQKIAHTLAREGLPFRIAGRSEEKLHALSARLPNHPQWLVADALQPATLPALCAGTRLLINLAGPFTDLGERVIAQAAMSGVNYLDVTNELGYVFRTRGYDEMARRSGAALVPACGFEVAFADCAAALVGRALLGEDYGAASPAASGAKPAPTAGDSAPIDQIDVVYALGGSGASRGTRRSAVRSLGTSWIAYRGGVWTGSIPGGQVQRFHHGPLNRHALNFPSSESVTLPAHLPVERVDAWMAATPGARFWAPVLVPLFARITRSILRDPILALASAGGLAPGEGEGGNSGGKAGSRETAPFTILVRARRGADSRWMTLEGKDPYGLTAEIAAYAARVMTASGYAKSGLLAPSQALGAEEFLGYAREHWGLVVKEGND